MLELYYTSAPSGLKPGSRGFCTVAASDALQKQKQLWDRLEALSGYRHHFQHNAQSTPSAKNPVSHAHWLLNLLGKEYHILSRVCDSGTDYTQRTNAFAHHLVLDNTELPEIGPAALLSAAGLLATTWNNTAGSLPPRSLDPFLNHRPATLVAQAWADLTGDSGYAALLAQAAEKAPRTPVCILFSAEQSDVLLPLLNESLALLPPHVRWQVTFNTYFTSMPTSASCAWRCCLVKTPAADAAVRWASGNTLGLVLNLTDLAKLPPVPANALATLARTGAAPAAQTPAKPTKITDDSAAIPVGRELPAEDASARMVLDISEDDFATVPAYRAQGPSKGVGKPPMPPPVSTRAPGYITVKTPSVPYRAPLPANRSIPVWALVAAILVLIVIVSFLVYFIVGMFSSPPIPVAPRPPGTAPAVSVVAPAPSVEPVPQVTTEPAATKPAVVATAPAVTIPAAVVPPKIAKIVVVKTPLTFHPAGSSMRDQTLTLALPAAEFDVVPLRSATALSLLLPNDKPTYTITQAELAGTLSMTANRLGFTIDWQDSVDRTAGGQVLSVKLEKSRATVDVSWRTGIILRRPEVATLAFWVLQNSTLVVADNSTAPAKLQRVVFRAIETKPLSLSDATGALELPADLPALAAPAAGAALKLPGGWTAEGYVDWPDNKDPATRTAQNAAYVMRFKKTTSVSAIDAWFLLTFRSGFTAVESTFPQSLANMQSDVTRFQNEIEGLDLDIKQVTEAANAEIAAQTNPVEIQARKNNLANTIGAKEAKKGQSEQILKGSKEALAAYRELQKTGFDLPLVLPDATPLVTLHFTPAK